MTDSPAPARRGPGMVSKAGLSALAVALQGSVRFVYSWLVGRVLGAATLGAVNSGISLALFASLLWPTATGLAVAKFVAQARGAGDADLAAGIAHRLARWTALSSVLLAIGAAGFASLVLGADAAQAAGVAVLTVAYSGYSYCRGLQYALDQVPRAVAWDAISAALAVAGLVVVLAVGSPWMLLLTLSSGYLLYTVVAWPRGERGEVPSSLVREMRSFVAVGVVATTATSGLLQLSMVVARLADTPARAGEFAAALSLATPLSMLARSFSLVLFPAISHAHARGDRESIRRQVDQATRGLAAVMVGLFGALVLSSELALRVVFGADFAEGATALSVMLVAVFATTLSIAAVDSMLATSRRGVRDTAVINVTGLLLGLAYWAIFVPAGGIDTVAVGYLVGAVVIGITPLVVMARRLRLRWWGLAARVGAGALAVAAGYAAEKYWSVDGWGQLAFSAGFLLLWAALEGGQLVRARAAARPPS